MLGDALEALRIVSLLAWPAVPATSAEILRRLGLRELGPEPLLEAVRWGGYPGGLPVEKGPSLFPRR